MSEKITPEEPLNLDLRLYGVTDRAWVGRQTFLQQLEEALQSGVTLVQLREKNLDEEMFLKEAREVKRLTDAYSVPLIVNDNVQVALACGAAGVHIGQTDGDAQKVRRLLGDHRILGVTAKTAEQAKEAEEAGADYIGSGAVFGSSTKKDARPLLREQLCEITAAVSIPVVAIGGINRDNVSGLAGTGIRGIAVISGIFGAENIGEAVRDLRRQADKIVGG